MSRTINVRPRPSPVAFLAGIFCLFGLLLAPLRSATAHQPHDDILTVAVSPAYERDRTVFIASGKLTIVMAVNVVLKSTDGGMTWDAVPQIPNYPVNALVISPSYEADGTVFISTTWGLFRSTDTGETWTDLTGNIGTVTVTVALSPDFETDRTVLAVGVEGGLFRSTDGGGTWTELPITGSDGRGEMPTSGCPPITEPGRRLLPEPYSEPTLTPSELLFDAQAAHAAAHEHARRADLISKTVIAFSPDYIRDQTLFVALEGQGLFRSTDRGLTWESIGQGMTDFEVTALVMPGDFSESRRLYAGTWGGGVFTSNDGGSTWTPVNEGVESLEITSLVLSPDFVVDETLFAATSVSKMFTSVNGGATWTKAGKIPRKQSDQTDVHYRTIGISPNYSADRTLFLCTFEGLWKSVDGGERWRYSDMLPPYLVRSMSMSPDFGTDRKVMAATYGGGVVRSDDAGLTWEPANTGIVNAYPDPTAYVAYPGNPVAYVGTVWGPHISFDDGRTWTVESVLGVTVWGRAIVPSPNFSTDHIVVIGVDQLGSGNPWWTTYQGHTVSSNGVFFSDNGGLTWMPTQLSGVGIHGVAISPGYTSDGTIFAVSLYSGLYRSTDGGLGWERLEETGPMGCCLARIALSPDYDVDRTLFVSRPVGPVDLRGLYKSTDGGLSWTRCTGTEDVTLLHIVLSPGFSTDRTVFIATLERGLLKSTDGGDAPIPTGLSEAYVTAVAISPDYAIDETLFAASYNGIFKSEDAGETWVHTTDEARYEEERPTVVKIGAWSWVFLPGSSSSCVGFSNRPGDTVGLSFVGSGVTVLGAKGMVFGMVDVYLDGQYQARVDLFASDTGLQQPIFQTDGLPFGEHTIALIITGSKNPLSEGIGFAVDGFDVRF